MSAFRPPPYVSINRHRLSGVLWVAFDRERQSLEETRFGFPVPRRIIRVAISPHAEPPYFRVDRYARVECRLPTSHRGWVFPDDPFITYEAKDERWCRPLKIGHEGYLSLPIVFNHALLTSDWREPDRPLMIEAMEVSACAHSQSSQQRQWSWAGGPKGDCWP